MTEILVSLHADQLCIDRHTIELAGDFRARAAWLATDECDNDAGYVAWQPVHNPPPEDI